MPRFSVRQRRRKRFQAEILKIICEVDEVGHAQACTDVSAEADAHIGVEALPENTKGMSYASNPRWSSHSCPELHAQFQRPQIAVAANACHLRGDRGTTCVSNNCKARVNFDASEWKRRSMKRVYAIELMKASSKYGIWMKKGEDAGIPTNRRPTTPDPYDREISKRTWEAKAMVWRRAWANLILHLDAERYDPGERSEEYFQRSPTTRASTACCIDNNEDAAAYHGKPASVNSYTSSHLRA